MGTMGACRKMFLYTKAARAAPMQGLSQTRKSQVRFEVRDIVMLPPACASRRSLLEMERTSEGKELALRRNALIGRTSRPNRRRLMSVSFTRG
jgi:hypothetical protein